MFWNDFLSGNALSLERGMKISRDKNCPASNGNPSPVTPVEGKDNAPPLRRLLSATRATHTSAPATR